MPARELPAAKIDRLLAARDANAALQVADELLAKLPSSPVGHLGRTRALLAIGRPLEAHRALDRALAVAPNDPVANTILANIDAQAGRDTEAIERLRPFALASSAQANEALLVLLDILYHSNRRDEWRALLERPGPWRQDPRALIHRARLVAVDDASAGIEGLIALFRGNAPLPQRRLAGFEAVALLDRAGDYRRAFDLATEIHTTMSEEFDLAVYARPVEEQLARATAEGNWVPRRAPTVQGVVLTCALPRSGTTLLEQMLDRHPSIGGIGEYAGIWTIYSELRKVGAWPRRPQEVSEEMCTALQKMYLDGPARFRRPGASWILDKSLRTWKSLPEVAAVLPGAVCLSVERDPRDLATSLFLSHFWHGQQSWTQSLRAIQRAIALHQQATPVLLETLQIPNVRVIYEELVDDPSTHARRVLDLLGLELDPRVLSPEENTRAAMTQSVAQVRRSINRSSIGRWRNYAFAFDESWEPLVALHESRRAEARSART